MIKRYDKYRPSGIEWIGEIPEHWGLSKLKYAAHEGTDNFQDGDWIESNVIVENGDYRYITTGNIGEGKYKEQGRSFITQETFDKLECLEIFPGDLLISRLNPPIGRSCIVPELGFRIVTSVDNVVLRPKESFDKKYIMYVTNSEHYYEYTGLIARGATMSRISRTLLGAVEIPFPSKEEQIAIANYLDNKTAEIDNFISKKQKLIELLNEEKALVINQAVNGRGKNWERKKLKYIAQIKYGLGQPPKQKDDGLPLIRATNIKRGRISEEDLIFVDPDDIPYERDPVLRENDIIVVRSGAYTADSAIISKKYEGAITGYDMVVRVAKDNPLFISFCLLSNDILINQLYLHRLRAAQPHLNKEELGETLLNMPSLKEQQEIVKYIQIKVQEIENAIGRIKKENGLMAEYKMSLISEVVTGKIKVI